MLRQRDDGAIELDAVKRALRLALVATCLGACESSHEFAIAVVIPDESGEFERADNATLVLQPGDQSVTFGVDGLDFSLEIELEPDSVARHLELYLAEGDELLAYGATAPFTLDGPDVDLALFLGRPGLLSTHPAELGDPDAGLLATAAQGRGMLLLESDGDTSLLNEFTLGIETGAELDAELAADDGGLFSVDNGSVVRMTWELGPAAAWRYLPSEDRWDALGVDAADTIGPRPGAAVLLDPDLTSIYLLGGGDQTDAVAIELVADDDGILAAAPVDEFALDGPRAGATAIWLPSADDPTADAMLVGGDDPTLPIVWVASSGASFGPPYSWVDAACAVRVDASESDELSVLCVGGLLDGLPSAAGLDASFGSGDPSVVLTESFLPVALPDPQLLRDSIALYALGEGRWLPIDREDGTVEDSDFTALCARGGHSVLIGSGATYVVGGVDVDGDALSRWQVFVPAIEF